MAWVFLSEPQAPHTSYVPTLILLLSVFLGAPAANAAIELGPSTIEAYASGTTVSDQQQNITGSGEYSQTASAPTASSGGYWSGYWSWTGTSWQWTWVYEPTSAQNTASYALTVDTANGALSMTGSTSAAQNDGAHVSNVFVTLNSNFSVTGSSQWVTLSATLDGSSSSISLQDLTTSQTLISGSTTFPATWAYLPTGDQFLLQYHTTNTYPGSDEFNFLTVPEPAGMAGLIGCIALIKRRRRQGSA